MAASLALMEHSDGSLHAQHAQIDQTLDSVLALGRAGHWTAYRRQLGTLRDGLEQHMAFEEEAVFPGLEQRAAVALKALRRDHADIRRHLEMLGAAVPEHDPGGCLAALADLAVLLHSHHGAEMTLDPQYASRPTPPLRLEEPPERRMFKRIDHIELLTAQPGRAVDFYTGVLGFKVRARDRVAETPMGPLDLVYLELGGTTVELMTYPEADLVRKPSGEALGYRMMALEVDDMDGALALLKARGVEPSWGPVRRPSYARAEIRDPDGNAIELRQWLAL